MKSQRTDDGRQVMAMPNGPGDLKMIKKKGNNSQTGNPNYFTIAGYVDLDMLNMFAV